MIYNYNEVIYNLYLYISIIIYLYLYISILYLYYNIILYNQNISINFCKLYKIYLNSLRLKYHEQNLIKISLKLSSTFIDLKINKYSSFKCIIQFIIKYNTWIVQHNIIHEINIDLNKDKQVNRYKQINININII